MFVSFCLDICSDFVQLFDNFTIEWIIKDDYVVFEVTGDALPNEYIGIGFSETIDVVSNIIIYNNN